MSDYKHSCGAVFPLSSVEFIQREAGNATTTYIINDEDGKGAQYRCLKCDRFFPVRYA